MNDMISYLKDFREEAPTWLSNYLQGGKLSFKDLMSSRVAYYPGYYQRCYCDGTLIKVGNKSHSVHSFLYVDNIKRKELEEQIAKEDSFSGYHLVGQIEWQEADIMPSGRHQILKTNNQETPYCFSMIMERDADKDDSWGAEHFVVTIFCGSYIEVYYRLFTKEYLKAPWIFLLNEGVKGDCFAQYIQSQHNYPQFVIFDKNANIWEGYNIVEDVTPVFGRFRRRRDLYVYSPSF